MIQLKRILLMVAALVSLTATTAEAQSAPQEQKSQMITRTAQSLNTATAVLSKNLFRTENVQVPYTVQVPYQETETYTEKVPYTVQVPYTDYETDYKDEYQCHNVTRYRNERRCENVTEYRDEQRCENQTDYRRECRNEQKCYIVPGNPGQCRDVEECGTSVHGDRICKTRRVCDQPGQPTNHCENQQICENVPYTRQVCHNVRVPYSRNVCHDVQVPYTDQECGNVRVPYQRPVTRYRDEVRYRDETRTRTVTKYRDETRCCKTESHQVFDRQLQYQVVLAFPQGAVLNAGELETLSVTLISAQPGSVSVKTVNSLYGYAIVSQSNAGDIINVQLGLVPLFDQSNAGATSIQNLQLVYSPMMDKFVVSFIDSVQHAKVQSASIVEIRDLATDALIQEGPAAILANGKLGLILQTTLPSNTKLKAIVKTTRTGSVVSQGQLSFSSVAIYDKRTLTSEDIQILSDSSRVQITAPSAVGASAMIRLTDSTELFENVRTQYTLSLFEVKANGKLSALNNPQTVSREQAQAANNEVTLARLLGNKASSVLQPGRVIRAQVAVSRSVNSSGLANPTPFTVVADVQIQ